MVRSWVSRSDESSNKQDCHFSKPSAEESPQIHSQPNPEAQAFEANKREAFLLEIKGSLSKEEQERLDYLKKEMDAYWKRTLARFRNDNHLDRLLKNINNTYSPKQAFAETSPLTPQGASTTEQSKQVNQTPQHLPSEQVAPQPLQEQSSLTQQVAPGHLNQSSLTQIDSEAIEQEAPQLQAKQSQSSPSLSGFNKQKPFYSKLESHEQESPTPKQVVDKTLLLVPNKQKPDFLLDKSEQPSPKQASKPTSVVSLNKEKLNASQQEESVQTQKPKELPHNTSGLKFNKEPNQKLELLKPQQAQLEPAQAKHHSQLYANNQNPLDWAREKALKAVSKFFKKIPAYNLLVLILGKDPITGSLVERNMDTVVRKLLEFVPGGKTLYDNLKKSGQLEQAYKWLNIQLTESQLTYEYILSEINKIWQTFGKINFFNIESKVKEIQTKVEDILNSAINRVNQLAKALKQKVLELTFEGFLKNTGKTSAEVMKALRKAGDAFGAIVGNPVGFLQNLVRALHGGFQGFSARFLDTYLPRGFTNWLFGTVGGGLQVPAKFDLQGFISIGLQVLELTYDDGIRPRISAAVGEKNLKRVEQIAKSTQKIQNNKYIEIFRKIINGGLNAAWREIKSDTKDLPRFYKNFENDIQQLLRQIIITRGIPKLISIFSPVGALIQAVTTIYNSILFFIERIKEIAALANAVFDSLANIAAGQVSAASKYIEEAMGRSVGIIIAFLAKLIGVNDIATRVKNLMSKIREPINNAINQLITRIANSIKNFLGVGKVQKISNNINKPAKATSANSKKPNATTNKPANTSNKKALDHDRKVKIGLDQIDKEEKRYLEVGKIWKIDAQKVAQKVKKDNPIFKSITVVDGRETWDYDWVASKGRKKGEQKAEKGKIPSLQIGLLIEIKNAVNKWDGKLYEITQIMQYEFVKAIVHPKKELSNTEFLRIKDYDKKWRIYNPQEKQESPKIPNLQLGDEIQVKEGRSWSINIMTIYLIKADQYIKAESQEPDGRRSDAKLIFSTYNQSWRKYNPNTTYNKKNWDKIKGLSEWNDFSNARQVLNYRCHNKFGNPLGMQWHHIHERSAGGPNSVENLAITTAENNQKFNVWFSQSQKGTEKVKLRMFLREKKASAAEHTAWGLKCIDAHGLKVVKFDKARGIFQQIVIK